jgi:Holliday junction resolvase RusA-like endonuclease
MTHTLTLLGRVPSKKNSKRRVQRGASVFMIPSQQHEDWHRDQMLAIRDYKTGWKHGLIHPNKITLEFYAPDRRKADLSNKTESVMDFLVDAGIIEDDNWFVIKVLLLKLVDIDKANPRVVLLFE